VIWISPLVGSKKPVNIFIVVDLPAPFGPKKPTTFPGIISNERSLTAWKPLKVLNKFLTEIIIILK
jgi:hypothetical protein